MAVSSCSWTWLFSSWKLSRKEVSSSSTESMRSQYSPRIQIMEALHGNETGRKNGIGTYTFIVFRRRGERPNERVITAGSYWQVLLAGLVAI